MSLTIKVDGDLEQFLRGTAKNNGIAVSRYTNSVLEKGVNVEKQEAQSSRNLCSKLQEEHGHWGEHPDYPQTDWGLEASNNETRLSYWDWVADKLQPR